MKAEAAKGKKKLPPQIAALQKQQEEKRKREEELARLEAEEKARLAEIERLEAERAQKEAEAKARRKEKEKEKKEQLKKEGKLLTKAQKEAKEKSELRMQQMLAAGATVAGLDETTEKKKPVYDNRKKKGPKKVDEEARLAEAQQVAAAEAQRLAEEQERLRLELEEQAKAEAEAEDAQDGGSDLGDWEAVANADEDVKESWDADTDEEKESSKTALNGKRAR